jgi:beta-glucosidase
MNTVLKGELGFKGFVQSDWQATHSTAKSVNAGLDMTMPGDIVFFSNDSYFGKNLTDAIDRKEVSEERATDMATRIVAAWYKVGQDKDFPNLTLDSFHMENAPFVDVQANHKNLVREMGAASTVLLKNSNSALPINPKNVKKVAIIGSDAFPDPYGLNSCSSHGCSNGTLAQGWGSGTADFPYLVDPLAGLSNAFGKNVEIKSTSDDWNLEEAAELSKDTDVAFVFSNADSGEQHITVDGNVGDRNNLTLWHNGDALVKY